MNRASGAVVKAERIATFTTFIMKTCIKTEETANYNKDTILTSRQWIYSATGCGKIHKHRERYRVKMRVKKMSKI